MTEKFVTSGLSPVEFWNQSADTYVNAMENAYHKERLDIIRSLVQQEPLAGSDVFEFGCGNASFLAELAGHGASVSGVDISPKMIEHGRHQLADADIPAELNVGSLESLSEYESESFDLILCLNVLAYLNPGDEQTFLEQAARLLRSGGRLIISESNELFDLFTLNSYTEDFFEKNFSLEQIKGADSLIRNSGKPGTPSFNVRLNPLSFPQKATAYGLTEREQKFFNYHAAPPLILEDKKHTPVPELSAEDQWKLKFQCSVYISHLEKA